MELDIDFIHVADRDGAEQLRPIGAERRMLRVGHLQQPPRDIGSREHALAVRPGDVRSQAEQHPQPKVQSLHLAHGALIHAPLRPVAGELQQPAVKQPCAAAGGPVDQRVGLAVAARQTDADDHARELLMGFDQQAAPLFQRPDLQREAGRVGCLTRFSRREVRLPLANALARLEFEMIVPRRRHRTLRKPFLQRLHQLASADVVFRSQLLLDKLSGCGPDGLSQFRTLRIAAVQLVQQRQRLIECPLPLVVSGFLVEVFLHRVLKSVQFGIVLQQVAVVVVGVVEAAGGDELLRLLEDQLLEQPRLLQIDVAPGQLVLGVGIFQRADHQLF